MRRILWWLPPLIILVIFFAAILDFAERTASTRFPDGSPVLGVVFTGQFTRVREGLALLENGKLDYLFVSGVNSRAGMNTKGFADQFDLSDDLRQELGDGRLVLSYRADDTFENASETRCWLNGLREEGAVVLITSTDHMPRASLMLEFALDGRRVGRISILDDSSSYRGYVTEFGKYLATYVLGLWQKIFGFHWTECDA